MGSPITFSGFNNIDFTTVLNAIMQQESLPLNALASQQTTLKAENAAYGVLATKLGALDSAAAALSHPDTFTKYRADSSNTTAVSASSSGVVAEGRYDVEVISLARAQVTASSSSAPDANTTVVATGGSLTIGGVIVTVTGALTLQGLADQVNHTSDIGVNASVIQSAPGTYRLVLSGTEPGAANAFAITNGLTGGAGVAFVDTNNNGVSGDSVADNAVNASNASLTVNNIAISSTTNTLTDAIAGVTLTLNQANQGQTVTVTVGRDDNDLTTRVKAFVTAYNDLVSFTNSQRTAAAGGASGTLARDPVLSSVRNQLRDVLLGKYSGGLYSYLSEIGIGPDRTGLLTLDSTAFSAAVAANPSEVAHLFTGSNNDGAFAAVQTLVTQYTQAGGFIPSATTQLNDQLSRIGTSIASMQSRLAVRRAALQKEFTAADEAMARLNSQMSSLSAFGVALSNSSISAN